MTQYLVPCWMCQRLVRSEIVSSKLKITCEAFPSGVPEPISSGENQHVEPYEGDQGIMYLRIPPNRVQEGQSPVNIDADPWNAGWMNILRKQREEGEE